ncbi:winged helix DNA-binding domain-containing protein [Actinoplanes sp. Pm04-4]|uniref:Winged helix DNA-binding domain-containing protein n=1 Tax=Paractinoplanes pyxinae TaxID=2997416 RepID=A0ABT4AQS4_9ACTN|nr:winged helix DNA-binding domain-containing protein [Actinoplanes pyxinae]MCY1136586.1 winged helix DNA-binding domain-containing protein [Actinoplanes pyxinae]
MKLSLDQVLSWRMRRQFLDRPKGVSTEQIVERLVGVQAQVASAAEQAVGVRHPASAATGEALRNRKLIRVWAMRGTLHLLTPDDAAAGLSLIAAARTWEKGAWQKTFATAAQVAEIADAAREVLHGEVLTREQLAARILERTRDDSLAELLGSGWGAVLKPLAWQGLLCHGPSEGNKITFTSPATWIDGWNGLPEPDEAAQRVIPAYLGAYGPATSDTFDQWLIRGASKKAALRKWFASLTDAGVLTEVTVDGRAAYARTKDLDDLAATEPFTGVRLLPAFDQFVLGPGTKNEEIIAPERRPLISKAAGWISPVVVSGGRVAGTWEAGDNGFSVTLFPEAGAVLRKDLKAEAGRMAKLAGIRPDLTVTTA